LKYLPIPGIVMLLLILNPISSRAQISPVYYPSDYLRVVQPEYDDSSDLAHNQYDLVNYHNPKVRYDTLLNPFTGGLNNPMFFNIDFNGDGISDLYVFDRDLNENQFLLFEGLSNQSTLYRYAPEYNFGFPEDVSRWVEMVDYNKDGKPDIFTGSNDAYCNTCIKAYKNTSYIDPASKKLTMQFTKAAEPLYYVYGTTGARNEINLSPTSNPQFVDADKDGYIDILGYGINGFYYFRNLGKGADSLIFEIESGCWGKFFQMLPHSYVPFNCPQNCCSGGPYYFSSVCAFDVDGDGDMDLLLGSGNFDSLTYLENGNINLAGKSAHVDSMINLLPQNDNQFPLDYPAKIATMPMPSLLDVNHDSINDMVISSGQPTGYLIDSAHVTDRTHDIWYYHNAGTKPANGSPGSNIFQLVSKDFLQNTMIDWGINSAPCFIDVDKDGRKDLIMAVNDGSEPKGNSRLVLYLNKAGKAPGSKPYLLYQTDDYLGFSGSGSDILNPIPAAYFNTRDNNTDLLMGNDSGHIMYFKDRSTGKNPADFHLSTSTLKYLSNGKMIPIAVHANSAPTSADINGDGNMDLLVGSSIGTISYYRCLGFDNSADHVPYFELVTDSFGGLSNLNGINYQSVPCVADLDKDGKADLLVGDRSGRLWFFHNFDTIHKLIPKYQVQVHDYGTGTDSAKILSTYIVPAVASLDQDSFPDIILGCRRGGLIFLGSAHNDLEKLRTTAIEESKPVESIKISLFPNPASNTVMVNYQNVLKTRNARVVISDMAGRQVFTKSFEMINGNGMEQISTASIINGIYIVEIITGDEFLYKSKLVIDK